MRRRNGAVIAALADVLARWLGQKWPVVLCAGGDSAFPQGAIKAFRDAGCPGTRCCSCSLFGCGVHKPGGVFSNARGVTNLVPACQGARCGPKACAGDGWEHRVAHWLVGSAGEVVTSLLHKSIAHHPVISIHPRHPARHDPSSHATENAKFAQVWPREVCQRICIGIQPLLRQSRRVRFVRSSDMLTQYELARGLWEGQGNPTGE